MWRAAAVRCNVVFSRFKPPPKLQSQHGEPSSKRKRKPRALFFLCRGLLGVLSQRSHNFVRKIVKRGVGDVLVAARSKPQISFQRYEGRQLRPLQQKVHLVHDKVEERRLANHVNELLPPAVHVHRWELFDIERLAQRGGGGVLGLRKSNLSRTDHGALDVEAVTLGERKMTKLDPPC